MLIVLSGLDAIHKKFFSREIVSALNNFSYEGYTVEFEGDEIKITNPQGEVVYQMGETVIKTILSNKDGSISPKGREIVEGVIALQNKVFNDESITDHFDYTFCNPLYDMGLVPDFFYGNQNEYQTYSYDKDIIENYNNREYENYVITGVFSKTYIEKLKADLGEENVTVVNIIRNPSAAFLLNEKEASFYAVNTKTPEIDQRKLEMSLLNATILKDVPGVITLKFEDIINDGKFMLLGKEVSVPPGHTKAGAYLTWWETEHVVAKKIVSPERLNNFNNTYSAFELMTNIKFHKDEKTQQECLDIFNAEFGSNVTLEQANASLGIEPDALDRKVRDCLPFFNATRKSNVTVEQLDELFPINIFDKLGYTPKTYDEVVKLN